MKVLVLLNTADAQSVPFELAAHMARHGTADVRIAAFSSPYESFPEQGWGVSVVQLGAKGRLALGAVGRLWRLMREMRPDIVHIHLWPSGLWGALLGRLAGARIVKTEHNDLKFSSLPKRAVNVLIYPLVSRLICNSQATLDSLGPPEKAAIGGRGLVVYNGVDFGDLEKADGRREDVRRQLGIEDSFVIGTVSRFVEQKNHLRLIRGFALALAKPGMAKAKLLLVGDGPLRADIESETRRLQIEDRVILVGAVDRGRVYELLRAMDLFIVPSLWEGFCNAAVEAAASSVAMAVADINTLREVLGSHALHFDPLNEAAIAQAMGEAAARSPEALAQSGRDASAFVRGRYAIGVAGERYEQIFTELTARR